MKIQTLRHVVCADVTAKYKVSQVILTRELEKKVNTQ